MYSMMAGNLPSASGRMRSAASFVPSRVGMTTLRTVLTLYFALVMRGLSVGNAGESVVPASRLSAATRRIYGERRDQRANGDMEGFSTTTCEQPLAVSRTQRTTGPYVRETAS